MIGFSTQRSYFSPQFGKRTDELNSTKQQPNEYKVIVSGDRKKPQYDLFSKVDGKPSFTQIGDVYGKGAYQLGDESDKVLHNQPGNVSLIKKAINTAFVNQKRHLRDGGN